MTYIKRYSYLVIVPAVLLLLHTPGFAPAEPGLKHSSGTYSAYYSQLSHPVLGRSNNLATILAFFIPLLFFWGHVRRDRRFTRAGFVTLIALAFTLSRGVILALLVTALLAALDNAVGRRSIDVRTVGKIAFAGVAISAGIALFRRFNPDAGKFFENRFSGANVAGRFDLATTALGKIADRPILGYGGGVVPDHNSKLAAGVHNTYLQQMLYYGPLLGVIGSLSLIGAAVFFLSRWRIGSVNRVIGFTLLAQLLIFITESSFEGTALRVIFYLSLGLATALARACEAADLGLR
jgi:hypothetical protein